MTSFEIARPASFAEAVALLDPDDPDVRAVGGGTAVMLMIKAGVLRPRRLVLLDGLPAEHAQVDIDGAGHLRIGGLARLATLELSPAVREGWPLLTRTLRTLSNPRVRNVATLGGNLAHADPHLDMPPVLSALGAQVTLVGPSGRRSVPAEQLQTGYYETILARNELVCEITVPPQAARPASYMKVTTRTADDWPAIGVACVLQASGNRITRADLFVGAATDKPTRLSAAESILTSADVSDALLKQAGEATAAALDIVGDSHGSASYKKQLLRVYVGRAVREALASSSKGNQR
jgi:carbon-monoxide dehydrogenase medium subunit